MMKVAILVSGEHFAGKSATINNHLKPLLGMKPKARFFNFKDKYRGLVLSQSYEEKRIGIDDLEGRLKGLNIVVIAVRPRWARRTSINEVTNTLVKLGFNKYQEFFITKGMPNELNYYAFQANAMYTFLGNVIK
jgi:hypothetical protein